MAPPLPLCRFFPDVLEPSSPPTIGEPQTISPDTFHVFRVPQEMIEYAWQSLVRRLRTTTKKRDLPNYIRLSKDFVHQLTHMVQILFADLHEHAAAWRQQFARQQQAIAHVGQVRVQPQLPRVAVRLH